MHNELLIYKACEMLIANMVKHDLYVVPLEYICRVSYAEFSLVYEKLETKNVSLLVIQFSPIVLWIRNLNMYKCINL